MLVEELTEDLTIESTHCGNNLYKLKEWYFELKSEPVEFSRNETSKVTNETVEKLAKNLPLLSPYCTWAIRFKPG